jgi:hypothetical protein
MAPVGQADDQGINTAAAVGAHREFLDSPKAEWLWEFAEANGKRLVPNRLHRRMDMHDVSWQLP